MEKKENYLLADVPKIAFRIYAKDNSSNINDTGVIFPFSAIGGATCWSYNSGTGEYYVPSTCGECVTNSTSEKILNMSQFTCET